MSRSDNNGRLDLLLLNGSLKDCFLCFIIDQVLEVTARAITYYLDVSAECTRRIVAVDGAIKAMCNRLVVADVTNRTSKDLAEQCIKVRHHPKLINVVVVVR